jgi:hypothetical protein
LPTFAPLSSRRFLAALIVATALTLLWLIGPGTGSALAAAPVCTDVSYTAESGKSLPIPVVGPCSDADGDFMQGGIVDPPDHGSIGPGPNGGGTYTSHPGYTGPDSFTYKVTAGGEDSNVATTTIDVVPATAGQPPACFDYTLQVYDTIGTFASANCFDPDTPGFQLTTTITDPPDHGTLTGPFGINGGARYDSDPGYAGTDELTYKVSDGTSEASAKVTFDVLPFPTGNQPPTCPASHAYVPTGGSVPLIANCVDPEGDSITYALASPSVTKGSIAFLSSSSVRYTPFASTPAGAEDELGYSAKDMFHSPVVFSVKISITEPGEDTFETAPEATEEEPYAASIESPTPGPVYIDTRAVTSTADTGFFYLDQEIDITAPPATDPADPLRFVFKLDSSKLEELDLGPEDVVVFRNGTPVPPCASPGAGVASPTPCIDARDVQGDGDLWLTALTMQASIWNLGASEVQDADDDGVPDDADNCVDDANPDQLDADGDDIGAACDSKEVPSSKDDCKGNGWKAFDGRYKFKNQGDCVSFVATWGKNQPKG